MKKVITTRFVADAEGMKKIYRDLDAVETLEEVLKKHEDEVIKKIIGNIKCYQGYQLNNETVNDIYQHFCFAFACEAWYNCFKVLECTGSLKEALQKTLKDTKTFEYAIGKRERFGDEAIRVPFSALTWAILQVK